jgi:ATP-dependent Zn protease
MGLGLGKIFSSGASDLVDSVGKVLDNVITTKAEKDQANLELQKVINDHEEKMASLTQAEVEAYLKDTQSARDANVRIQESDKASWLAKNVSYILALVITVGFFGLLSYMLKFEVPNGNKDVMNILLGSLGTAWITIVGFFFGSSIGSKEANASLKKVLSK